MGCVKTTPHKSIFAMWISTRNFSNKSKKWRCLVYWQQVNSAHRATSPATRGTNRSTCKLTNTSTTDSWALWIEPQLSLFVFSLSSLLWVSASLDCFSLFRWSHTALVQVRTHPMLHAHVSSLSVAPHLFDTSIQLLLLPHHLSDHPVLPTARQLQLPRCGGHILRTSAEDLGTLCRGRPSHRLWAQRPLHHRGLCRIHPRVHQRAAVPRWLRQRWRHHRQDAPWRAPKTSRSLWRRRPVVLSVVVSQTW